ncbi:hypothetical protein CEUSTIGMA_g6706.t1 [Chlamydomonas eustigma]|uniref:Uncharacterized protein n=1 Tax=Chlamydomonas eustigma TaxID=1157962 RepID=A0A250X883_9CHLO|nr:hypothetical protein CEUSTIGMA_g6706.t1 [Chlamydomonas eustigma]|eukprot:GAX79266.1 hypothetical protein CEUSTIGMA_g6706.t1 [Chlamydomonas eustigma]
MMLVMKPRMTYEMLTKQEENVPVLNKIVNEVLKIDGFPTLDILQRTTNEATASHVKNLILVKIHNQMKDMTKTETKRKLGYLTVEQAEDFKKVNKQRSSGSGLTMEVQDVNDEQDYHHEALENIARAIEPDLRQKR